eukprot:gene48192-17819_t
MEEEERRKREEEERMQREEEDRRKREEEQRMLREEEERRKREEEQRREGGERSNREEDERRQREAEERRKQEEEQRRLREEEERRKRYEEERRQREAEERRRHEEEQRRLREAEERRKREEEQQREEEDGRGAGPARARDMSAFDKTVLGWIGDSTVSKDRKLGAWAVAPWAVPPPLPPWAVGPLGCRTGPRVHVDYGLLDRIAQQKSCVESGTPFVPDAEDAVRSPLSPETTKGIKAFDKPDAEVRWLLGRLRDEFLFEHLEDFELERATCARPPTAGARVGQVVSAIEMRTCQKGDRLFTEGEEGDTLYNGASGNRRRL